MPQSGQFPKRQRDRENNFNLNISRYVSTAVVEESVDIAGVKKNLDEIEETISKAKARHNKFLKELAMK